MGHLVINIDHCIDLFEVEHVTTVVCQHLNGSLCVALSAKGFHDDDAHLRPLMLRIKVYKVYHSHRLLLFVLDNQSHLSVDIDIVLRISNIVMQCVATVRTFVALTFQRLRSFSM